MFPCRQVIFSMVFSIRELLLLLRLLLLRLLLRLLLLRRLLLLLLTTTTSTSTTTTTPATTTTTTMGFRSYIRHFRGAILGLLRPSEAWCFPAGRQVLLLLLLLLLLLVSEVTLGIFGVQFWGFSVLQRHGVSLPAGDFFHGVFHPGTYYYYYDYYYYYYGFQKLH